MRICGFNILFRYIPVPVCIENYSSISADFILSSTIYIYLKALLARVAYIVHTIGLLQQNILLSNKQLLLALILNYLGSVCTNPPLAAHGAV